MKGEVLKIGLNATCINDRPSGARQRFVGIYGEVVKQLPETEFVVYEPVDCRMDSWFGGAPNVSTRRTTIPSEGRIRKILGGLGYWKPALRGEGFDVFDVSHLPMVKAPSGKTLLTIHDMRRIHPDWGSFEHVAYKMALHRAMRSVDHVIAVSESMRTEILGFFPKVRVSVIYNGLDAAGFRAVTEVDAQALRRKHGLPEAFVLAVGHFEKRKNYLRLIDAFALLRDRGHPQSLVIIGNDSGERRVVEERVQAANLSGYVKILSGLSDLEVRCAYKLASLFVFPSYREGFGIPVLEAMAAECAMVLSDIPVFNEITEGKGVYFPYDDTDAMAHAIEAVLSSNTERSRLIEYGRARIRAFGFDALGRQLAALYSELA
jgi:glycosyltransferase involved in cell wall biosynthesis